MTIDLNKLITRNGEWLSGQGPEADIVICSRVRLARNLATYRFATRMDADDQSKVESEALAALKTINNGSNSEYLSVESSDTTDRLLLVERHLISRELANGEGPRGAWVSEKEDVSIMVNEEDHLRIQTLRSGLRLQETWEDANRYDDVLDERLQYAWSEKYGYLTACPTNTGTGLRLSVMLHIPALVIGNQMQMVLKNLARINCAVRGLFGEGTHAMGDFYQISNQVTLGRPEDLLLTEMQNIVEEIVALERDFRSKIDTDRSANLHDRIWRAYGILSNARIINSEETLQLLSALRLGVNLGLLTDVNIATLNELFLVIQPGHLQKLHGHELDADERDHFRAEYIRERLAGS